MSLNSLCHDWTGPEALLTFCFTFSSQSCKNIGQKGLLEIIRSNLPCDLGLLPVLDQVNHGFIHVSLEKPQGWRFQSPWRNNSMNLLQCCTVLLESPNLHNGNLCPLPLVPLSVAMEKSFAPSPLWLPFKHCRLLIDCCLAALCQTEQAQLPHCSLMANDQPLLPDAWTVLVALRWTLSSFSTSPSKLDTDSRYALASAPHRQCLNESPSSQLT